MIEFEPHFFDQVLIGDAKPTPVEISARLMDAIPRSMQYLRSMNRARRGSGLSVPQMRTLFQVRRGPKTNKSLADSIGVSVPSMSRLVAGLVDRGLILRKVTPEDRREYLLFLTAKGEKLVSEVRKNSVQDLAAKVAMLDNNKRASLYSAAQIMIEILRN